MQLQHANLPETAQQIADVIGVENTMELVRAKQGKGQFLYVPTSKRLRPSHVLVQILGAEVARELAEEFGGIQIKLPKCRSLLNEDRNQKIIQMRQQSMKYHDIAVELCMSVSSVKMTYSRWIKSHN
ncbi:Mor transcription activator family protein [Halodesulfovibrio aestuarii]|uniref:Mor transcription activator family protein n=1 Tax=Halodesulfovibrio aestuarii TaxID=126333 RepID=UPI003D32FCC8